MEKELQFAIKIHSARTTYSPCTAVTNFHADWAGLAAQGETFTTSSLGVRHVPPPLRSNSLQVNVVHRQCKRDTGGL